MKKDLVVFYSRSGATRQLAETLAAALDADLDEIREGRSRKGWQGFLRSTWDGFSERETPIVATRRSPRKYQRVIVGTPVWATHVASPVRSYLSEHGSGLQKTAFFCTYGLSCGQAFEEMTALTRREPVATLALNAHGGVDVHSPKVTDFVAQLQR